MGGTDVTEASMLVERKNDFQESSVLSNLRAPS